MFSYFSNIGSLCRANSSSNLLLKILILMVFLEAPLKAYADPGSGLLLWQLAGAFFLGLIYQVRKFFSRRKTK
jgi:hypothetical protein